MRKYSLQLRLTCLSAVLLTVSCVILYILICNSAVMKMDSVESDVMRVTLFENELDEGDSISIDLVTVLPVLQENLAKTKQAFRVQCLGLTIIIIIVGTTLTWIISGIALKPLNNLSRRIGDITANNLSEELPVSGPKDEIFTLTTSFNRMLQRLDSAFLSQKQFVANAAHELRTPLTIMQTNLEVCMKKSDNTIASYQDVLDTTLHQTEQLGNLTNTLLELMSLHTATLTDQVELSGLIDEIFCDLAPISEAQDITTEQFGPEVTIQGNEILLYRTFYNLIENSIKYNHIYGKVSANIELCTNKVRVSITDTGEGIQADQWNQIFEPFYRIDKARSRSMGGAGLGLALVSDIVSLHAGNIFVKNSSANGTTICVEFPY